MRTNPVHLMLYYQLDVYLYIVETSLILCHQYGRTCVIEINKEINFF